MAIFTLTEILNLAIVTLVISYIFSGSIKRPATEYSLTSTSFAYDDYKLALLSAAPGVILHELAHKFVAIFSGLTAYFQAWWFGLGIGVFLKFINSPFIIVAPGYVSISGLYDPLLIGITSFAGPLTNLLLFGISHYILTHRKLKRNTAIVWYLSRQINMVLFIFNMIPIPPLDGYKVFSSLIQIISSS